MSDKARRQALIVEALQKEQIRSQEGLRNVLRQRGLDATQGAISRDLRDLGVVKTPSGYALPGSASAVARGVAGLERAAREMLLSAATTGQIVVLRTNPGRAGALSVELDAAGLTGVVGTIAGDDTIFIAAESPTAAKALQQRLQDTAGIKGN